jgi:hypothetical protein
MKKKGPMFSDLYIYWKEIVGEGLSEFTWPEKLANENGLVLYIKAKSTKLIEAQYSSSILLDKINSFFGNNKISQIKICRSFDS